MQRMDIRTHARTPCTTVQEYVGGNWVHSFYLKRINLNRIPKILHGPVLYIFKRHMKIICTRVYI